MKERSHKLGGSSMEFEIAVGAGGETKKKTGTFPASSYTPFWQVSTPFLAPRLTGAQQLHLQFIWLGENVKEWQFRACWG